MPVPTSEPRLRYFPVSFFAMVMGLTGLAIAWHKAQTTFALPHWRGSRGCCGWSPPSCTCC